MNDPFQVPEQKTRYQLQQPGILAGNQASMLKKGLYSPGMASPVASIFVLSCITAIRQIYIFFPRIKNNGEKASKVCFW
jgi:hypothetical protein